MIIGKSKIQEKKNLRALKNVGTTRKDKNAVLNYASRKENRLVTRVEKTVECVPSQSSTCP
jgi:hypothetical protein